MSNIEETAYPRLRDDISAQELDQLYTPTTKERKFVADAYRRPMPQTCLMLQLKLMQRLGYAVPLAVVPLAIVAHVCRRIKPLLNFEWVDGGSFRLVAGVKGGRSPAQRTLDPSRQPVRWPLWPVRHAAASAIRSRSDSHA